MFISRFIQANYFMKYLAENAVNTISEPLDFKIFWGEGAPRPPYKLAPLALVFSTLSFVLKIAQLGFSQAVKTMKINL